MHVERHAVTITTDASGDATGYTPAVTGRVLSIQYVKTDYADGVDFTITGAITGTGLWTDTNVNAAETVCPRAPVHDQAGAALLYAAGGTAQVDAVYLANERVKIIVGSGGNAKVGTFYVTVG